MKLLADEGVDGPIVDLLRRQGHDVTYVAEMAPGTPDDEVLQVAERSGAQLLTTDKDFGELVFRQGRLSAGVVLLRLGGLSPAKKAEIVAKVLRTLSDELEGTFAVLSPGVVRIRRREPPS